MLKGQNTNRPQPGSQIKVDPIRKLKDIENIKKLLADNPRNLALFVIGINTNLRASDLLRITVGQVRGLNAGDEITLKEKKTGKARRITLNRSCVEAIRGLLGTRSYADADPLFLGQRGCLTVPAVHSLVKSWCRALNLRGNYGSHTLRKTFGYIQRVYGGADIPTLMQCFNHSSQAQTLAYLGIQPEDIKRLYMYEI
jgi:integrase